MIELAHQLAEPAELRQHRTGNPGGTWDDPAFGAVKTIVRHQLNGEQEGLCVYCETELGEDEGHVEHIKSKGVNPPLTFVYDNLAHSCDGHCADFSLPVWPLREDGADEGRLMLVTRNLPPARLVSAWPLKSPQHSRSQESVLRSAFF